jgi:multicomponent Na+:H+ antiporter subunit E
MRMITTGSGNAKYFKILPKVVGLYSFAMNLIRQMYKVTYEVMTQYNMSPGIVKFL